MLQEVNSLNALDRLIEDSRYAEYNRVITLNLDDEPFNQRNLVVLSNSEIISSRDVKHSIIESPKYSAVTGNAPENITWERPIQYVQVEVGGSTIHLINLHLKSKIPANLDDQKVDRFTWKSSSAWAEGFFISSIRRVGQALETRVLIDQIFDENIDAKIIVGGDFNSDLRDVPMEAVLGRIENTNNKDLNLREMMATELGIPESKRFSLIHRGRKQMIDHLIISRRLLSDYKNTEIHNETLKDESIAFSTDDKYPESDHAPVVIEFDI